MEALGVDSVWLPDVVTRDIPDPFIGLAYAAARSTKLKLGTGVTVLPGRSPFAVAKELASLAALAPGRVLPAFGVQHARPTERGMFPVPGPRGEVFDESLILLRQLLENDHVDFDGRYFTYAGRSVQPRPVRPLDLWLGGSGPVALRRVGRLADGWLGATVTPAEAAAARKVIEAAAATAERTIDDDHYGMSLGVAFGDYSTKEISLLRAKKPEVDPGELVPVGWAATRALISRFVDSGVSKFVIRPVTPVASWRRFLDEFTECLLDLEA
jgi:probable F420-dependent oxidoreductase